MREITDREKAVARGKREIVEDVKAGRVPADVASFSALHDHVDANEYGGLCDENAPTMSDDEMNGVQNDLDAWLKSGGIENVDQPRFTFIRWMRGSISITDTHYPIGHPRRRQGRGFRTQRDAERYCRDLNAREESM